MASPFVATARSGRAEHRQVVRARIVLAAADGQSNAGIARELRPPPRSPRNPRPAAGWVGKSHLD